MNMFAEQAKLALKKNNNNPMTIEEIWQEIKNSIVTNGKTPKNSLSTILAGFSNSKKEFAIVPESKPRKFYLLEKEIAKTEKKTIAIPTVQRTTSSFDDLPEYLKPKNLRTKFTLKEDVFQDFDKTLRVHQRNSVNVLRDADIGQINIPTGTGKTYVQKHIHIEDMIKKTKLNQTGVYVIAAHRLALCTQLFNEVLDLLIQCGIKADMIYVGSERYNFDKLNKKYKAQGYAIEGIDGNQTTSSKTILDKVDVAKSKNRHVIIVSTYHSFDRLEKLDFIDIVTFDEAHTTTNEQFTENISAVRDKIGRSFFFTATRKVHGEDGGQNDESFYGPVLYAMSPKEAIEAGEIVRPRTHEITSKNLRDVDIDSNEDMMIQTVIEAFDKHRKKVKEVSFSKDDIDAKMLITVNGLKELKSIVENKTFVDYCKSNNISIFSFSSTDGEFINFKTANRQATLDKMSALKLNEKAMFFHYDILTEGIDLPVITGVLILRDLPTIKLLQNIGRGARLIKEDRTAIYSGKIQSYELTKMIKPYCWVIIPTYLKTLQDGDGIKKIIKTIREEYGIISEEMGEEDEALADADHKIPRVTEKEKKKSNCKIDELNHVYENILIEAFVNHITNAENPTEELVKFLENSNVN